MMRFVALMAVVLLLSSCSMRTSVFLHDKCIGENTAQPDTCLHAQRHQESFIAPGSDGKTYDLTVRVRGLFEPTTMQGGVAPDPANPYFYVGGETSTKDYSQWRIDVSSPKQTYTLNHYPSVSHTIYKQDFEVRIPATAGAEITIQVIDGNDRQIDNAAKNRPDRGQVIEGVTDTPLAGQLVRIDLVDIKQR